MSTAQVANCAWCMCVQLLALLLHKLPGDYEMSEELAEGLQKAMLERLRDRQPPVRVQAISALSRLADPGQVLTATCLQKGMHA